MHKNTILFVIIAGLGGFIAGFWLANSINRSETSAIRSQNDRTVSANSNSSQTTGEPDLTNDEIKAKIAEADRSAGNFAFQKNLGVALYKYAAMKQDVDLLTEAVRILTRANTLDAKDYDVLVALGNAHFDIGFNKKNAASYQTARGVYSKALEQKPGDADVRTDHGLTYFLQDPPDYEKAVAEFQKAIRSNPKHERSLQFLTQTYTKQNKLTDAEKSLAQLKALNPANPAIAELSSQISAAQNGVK